jgi:predicted RNA-binding Zn-ribbon protein involved in translation (DUF1610 family)
MVTKRRRVKSAKSSLCCPKCGEPVYIVKTKMRGRMLRDRVCKCRACGWRGETVEQFKEAP